MSENNNPALDDLKAIVESKPNLSPEEQLVADKIMHHLKATLRPEVRKELEVDYTIAQQKFEAELSEKTKIMVSEQIEQWKKAQKPLSREEINQLLSSDYDTFNVKIKTRDGSVREFELVELPQEAEERFLKVLKTKGIPALKTIAVAEFKVNGDLPDQLESLLDSSEALLNVARELAMTALDPWGDKNVTVDWVRTNMSSYRVLAVIIGQIELNKYRDFFSRGFQLSKMTR